MGAKKESGSLDIEKPALDLRTSTPKDLPDHVPDIFKHHIEKKATGAEQIAPMARDAQILIAIGDAQGAKKIYRNIRKIYDKLPDKEQKKHFVHLNKLYKELKKKDSLSSKVKSLFGAKKQSI